MALSSDDRRDLPPRPLEEHLASVLPFLALGSPDNTASIPLEDGRTLELKVALKPAFAWPSLDRPPELGQHEVHVWSILLDQDETLAGDWEILSCDEKDRATRFHAQKDRVHYVCAHGNLRRLLGAYLGIPPADIGFSIGENGKPALHSRHKSTLQFNLTHSEQVALIAVMDVCPVGVDVEKVRSIQERDMVARCFFAPREVERYQELPESDRELGFFQCWTRKEAFLKARGLGITSGLESCEVSFGAASKPELRDLRNEPEECGKWELFDLAPAPGYIAALAARAKATIVRTWRYCPHETR